jgi:ABC-type glycerol-3-phosphate transport system substrate-binding protein
MESPKLPRRTVLKTGAGAAAFAATTNIFTPLKTFAARDQKLIFWLQPNFNPTADRILEDQTRAFAKQAGLKDSELQILKVPGGEIPTRMAAALEVGAPPDVTRLEEGYVARMRAQKALLDITDIMNEMKKVPGGVNPSVIPLTEDGGRNFAVPMGLNPEVMHARMDLLEQAGYSAFPETRPR